MTRTLEQRLIDLERAVESQRRARDHATLPRVWHHGKTSARSGETYPTAGNVLPVMFQDWTFTEADGETSLTQTDLSATGIAWAYFPEYRAEDTKALLFEINGRWWGFPVECE